ncbi:MAG: site-specific DNA-methyltransferase [Caldilineaceae bacterium]|nr:site-specific DNA-methyltransferase [Caldilineaceae bacterium]MDE0337684.1 site-specific DNA-methyltransferase [Caldilineaceae bacterium]
MFTSPPYALLRAKEYGNEPEHKYVQWFRPFAKQIYRILKPTGSLILNLGGAWKPGAPVRSLYQYQLLIDLCAPSKRRKEPPVFFMAQEFYWFNPAKLPGPVQWVNVERVRVKDSVEPIWWLSKTPNPKATNRSVLKPYSKHMERLIKTQNYNKGPRPSGWVASKKWGKDNGGAIPANFLTEDGLSTLFNVLVESNTSSNDPMRRALRKEGIDAHPAIFPLSLPEFFIHLTTDEGDVVVDPFCGSNTTGYVAESLNRQWLSIDVERGYLDASRARWANDYEGVFREVGE